METIATLHPQAPGFIAGFLLALFIVGLAWLYSDRKALKAKVEALETDAKLGVNKMAHDLSLVQAAPPVVGNDIKEVFAKFMADIKTEAVKAEALKTAATVTVTSSPVV